jgi:hypothetical protein
VAEIWFHASIISQRKKKTTFLEIFFWEGNEQRAESKEQRAKSKEQ